MRVRSTHYTIKAGYLKSRAVESSLDGFGWFARGTAIDRDTDSEDFKDGLETASFAVSNSTECRFIRLTQRDKRHVENDYMYLAIETFEVFRTLLE
jgi:hypothetical protein